MYSPLTFSHSEEYGPNKSIRSLESKPQRLQCPHCCGLARLLCLQTTETHLNIPTNGDVLEGHGAAPRTQTGKAQSPVLEGGRSRYRGSWEVKACGQHPYASLHTLLTWISLSFHLVQESDSQETWPDWPNVGHTPAPWHGQDTLMFLPGPQGQGGDVAQPSPRLSP